MQADENNVIIEARELTRKFGDFTAVDKISFAIKKGEIFGFLGPNGAGKSTTIRMFCGLLKPTAGLGFVNGIDISRYPEKVRETIGYMSQKFSLYRDLTVIENLKFFGGIYGLRGRELETRIDETFEQVGLDIAKKRLTGELSGALAQRVALSCAILHKPAVLFLDEPTSGIDPIARRMFWVLIQDLASSGVTILVTTHFLDEAEFCQRIGFINFGRLIATATPQKFKNEIINEDVFEVSLSFEHNLREKLLNIDGIIDVSYFGNKLHIFVRRNSFTAQSLEEKIKANGLKQCSVQKINPRLEDVFVRLAGKQPENLNVT